MQKYFNPDFFKRKNSEEYIVKIKLVLTSTGIWPTLPKVANKIASSVIYSGTAVKMGLVHAAIQIGMYLIDWARAANLVSIRPIKSNRAMIAADIEKGLLYRGTDRNEVEQILRALASRIVYWNVHLTFNFVKRNCQVFVMDCLSALHLEYKFSSEITNYFKWLTKRCYSKNKKKNLSTPLIIVNIIFNPIINLMILFIYFWILNLILQVIILLLGIY